jgi:hypothetical protein
VKRLSRFDLEEIAGRVFRAYTKLPEIVDQPLFRVEPEVLCEQLLGLKIDYRGLSIDGSVLGLTSYEKVGIELPNQNGNREMYILDGKTVLIEERLRTREGQDGRRNFTITHEASHQILKMLYPADYGEQKIHCCRANAASKSPITDWEEWQSNTLAAAILLPKVLVEQAMCCCNVPDGIRILNRIYAKRDYDCFVAMTEMLGCSKSALAIRMKGFGFLGESYLNDPYRLIDVEVD